MFSRFFLRSRTRFALWHAACVASCGHIQNAGDAYMKPKQIAAAAASLLLLWGSAQAEPEAARNAQAQPEAAAEMPQGSGATSGEVIVFEMAPTQGQGSE